MPSRCFLLALLPLVAFCEESTTESTAQATSQAKTEQMMWPFADQWGIPYTQTIMSNNPLLHMVSPAVGINPYMVSYAQHMSNPAENPYLFFTWAQFYFYW